MKPHTDYDAPPAPATHLGYIGSLSPLENIDINCRLTVKILWDQMFVIGIVVDDGGGVVVIGLVVVRFPFLSSSLSLFPLTLIYFSTPGIDFELELICCFILLLLLSSIFIVGN